ncbi:MAG: hypothetical protein K1X86_00110 [Ignavibacteria bacterium]|nr:hypothetical protein [Ignavibacteria bacterium]
MIKKKNDIYHVQIKTDFLLNSYKQFKSEYTPWVYLVLKLKCNYYLKHTPHSFNKIMSRDSLAGFFDVNQSTIHHSFNELIDAGLLEKKNKTYRLIKEDNFIESYRTIHNIDKSKIVDFIKIFYNDFYKFANDIFNERRKPNSQRLVIKAIRIYYYLYTKNRHCFNEGTGIVETSESQSSIVRNLKHDPKTVKEVLEMLSNAGYVKLDSDIKISTLNKKTFDTEWDKKLAKKREDEFRRNSEIKRHGLSRNIEVPNSDVKDSNIIEPKVPDNFIGYCKYDIPPYKRMLIYYTNNRKYICQETVGEGDGLPPTEHENVIRESLLNSGHKSQYYDKNSYWLFNKPKTDAKAA